MSQNLINIRNHEDNKCFELCFTAAYSLKHGVDLHLTDQQKVNPAARGHNLIHTFQAKKNFGFSTGTML